MEVSNSETLTMPSQRASGSDAQKLALDTSDLVLTVLRDAARLAPIPYLKDAAGLALEIVNLIQVSRNLPVFLGD